MDDAEPSHRGNTPGLPIDHVVDGKYELRGVLGEGGTGIVYDAIRISDQSPVALKVMHAHLAGDKQIRGRFQREAAILRRHDLSLAIPLSSICYFAIIAAGTVFLHESVAVAQWVGLIVIGVGLALISWK